MTVTNITVIDCGGLDDPINGLVTLEDTVLESVATYSCQDGYTLVGDDTRLCVDEGTWSGDAPVCEGVCTHVYSACYSFYCKTSFNKSIYLATNMCVVPT